jgi:PIN domain nuclease of toxin-antitoxin system
MQPVSDFLFDTHALIWTVEDHPISAAAEHAISSAAVKGQPIYVSPITAWERGMLIAKGRMSSSLSPKAWFQSVVSRPQIALAELTADILTDASFLPAPLHGDPADRILIATARALNLTLITRDRGILRYAALGHVRAIAC